MAAELATVTFSIEGEGDAADYARLLGRLATFHDDLAALDILSRTASGDPAESINPQRATADLMHAAVRVLDEKRRAMMRSGKFMPGEQPLLGPTLLQSGARHSGDGELQRLRITAWAMSSPGATDLAGIGEVLTQLRLYLADRHERRKDKDFRNEAEQERLRLENLLLRLECVQRAQEVMERAGLSEAESQLAIMRMVGEDAARLVYEARELGFGKRIPEQSAAELVAGEGDLNT